jgi:steroid delta-isomerase-like uncharacterized protein
MAETEIAVVRRWFAEVWNNGRSEAMEELLAADAPVYGLQSGNDVVRGPAGFRPFYEQLTRAFSGIFFTIEQAISEGDMVAVRWSAQMTHTGDHLGAAPTGNSVKITGMVFARVRDGKVVEGWNNWDMMGLMQGIGLAPSATVSPTLPTP